MLGWWGFLSKRQRKSAISKHCQSTYHDTLSKGNLVFFIIILTIITTYRLPNQDKAGNLKGYHCCEIYRMDN